MTPQALEPGGRLADAAGEIRMFSTNQVHKLTGASLRQLQWWDEQGIVPVKISGRYREYTELQLRKCHVLAQLRDPRKSGMCSPADVARISRKALECRWLLFIHGGKQLIGASNDKAEIVKIASQSMCGVTLIELPII